MSYPSHCGGKAHDTIFIQKFKSTHLLSNFQLKLGFVKLPEQRLLAAGMTKGGAQEGKYYRRITALKFIYLFIYMSLRNFISIENNPAIPRSSLFASSSSRFTHCIRSLPEMSAKQEHNSAKQEHNPAPLQVLAPTYWIASFSTSLAFSLSSLSHAQAAGKHTQTLNPRGLLLCQLNKSWHRVQQLLVPVDQLFVHCHHFSVQRRAFRDVGHQHGNPVC